MRIPLIGLTRSTAPVAAALLLGCVAGPGRAKDDAQIKDIRRRLGMVRGQLARIRNDLARDAAIHEARKAAAAAREACAAARKRWDQARRAYEAARAAIGKAEMAHGKRARALIEADAEARGLLKDSERLEALARAADAKIADRRKALESAGPVAAAKKAWTDAQARVVQARKAYEKALKDALESDPQMKRLNEQRRQRWRDYQRVRRRLNEVKRLLLMGPGPLSARRAYDAAVRAEKETYRAKLTQPDGGEALRTVESLRPKLNALAARLSAVYRRIDAANEVKAAKTAWNESRRAAQDAYKAYLKARDDAVAQDRAGAALLEQFKRTKDPRRRAEIERNLAPHRRRAEKAENVVRAKRAYRDLSRRDAAAYNAYVAARDKLVSADAEGAGLLAEIKRIRSRYDPANTKLAGFRRAANKDPDVIAAREKVVRARSELVRANAAYEKALDAKVAALPEGSRLLRERARLEAKLKALTK